MRLLLALPFALFASASLAAGWQSGMVEDEGGPVMMAWVEGEGGDVPPELRMMCGERVNIRYGFGSGPGEGVEPVRDPLNFTFDFGGILYTLPMQYEEMDGTYAAYIEDRNDLILTLLRTLPKVQIDDPTGTWHTQEFTLEGSGKAIAAVVKSCH